MRASQWFLVTQKETPNDAEIASHQLMLRSGMIRKLGSGLYTWMPLGLRVLRKVENIVREEMNKTHAMELLMPSVQPAELWQETGRWETFGGQLLTMKDSNQREYCFGIPMKRSLPISCVMNCNRINNCQSIFIKYKPSFAMKSDHGLG